MDTLVFAAVLAAAFLHAAWNAALKLGLDRFSSVILLAVVQALIAIPILPFVEQPLWAAWPWILASIALHVGYKIFLINAYQYGDLSQVYPLARGSAPLLVAIISGPVIGEPLSPAALAATFAIGTGVILMGLKGGADLGRMNGKALAYALGTAGFTASYTIVDGMGARVAQSPSGFILWMVVGDAIGMLIYGWLLRGPRALTASIAAWRIGIAAGAMSLGSYWIAVWAFAHAPIALVAALRETSVLFAVLLAVVFLGERATPWRFVAAAAILGGVVTMRL
jgi:drug/metabolite transporter (DMT)-like permease